MKGISAGLDCLRSSVAFNDSTHWVGWWIFNPAVLFLFSERVSFFLTILVSICASSAPSLLFCHTFASVVISYSALFPSVGLFPVNLIAPMSPNILCIEPRSDACDLMSFDRVDISSKNFHLWIRLSSIHADLL